SVGQDGGQNLHHLPVAIVATRQPGADLLQGRRQRPIFEWRPVPERPRLARQHRHVVPGIICDLVAPEPPCMLANDDAILLDYYTIGIGMHVDRAANGLRGHRVLVVVEAHEARLRYRDTRRMEAVEWPPIARQVRALGLENLKDRLVLLLGMKLRLCVGDALLEKIGVEILIAVEVEPWLEQTVAKRPNLALYLPLLPARRRRAGRGLDEVMAHQLLEAAVELAFLADDPGLNRRTHVVVDAALAAPLEKLERLLVRVEHHLLGLARVCPHERHPAVAQANLRHLGLCRHPGDDDNLVAPVELVGLTRRKDQRYVGDRRALAHAHLPLPREAAYRIVAAGVASPPQLYEHAIVGQAFAFGLLRALGEHLLQCRHVRSQPRPRLFSAHVAVLGLILGANDVPHRIACQLQITRNRLDLPLLYEVRPTNPRDRIHSHHPPLDPWRESRTRGRFTTRGAGSILDADHPQRGDKIARRSTTC